MTNEEKFKKNLVALFTNFGQEPDVDRIRFLSQAVKASVGFDHNWDKVFFSIASKEKFFPPAAVIVDHTKKISGVGEEPTLRQKAEMCVDRYIMYLRGSMKHEEISPYDHLYCRKRFGVDKHSVQSGLVDLNFKRREWCDICEIDYETWVRTGSLDIMAPEIAALKAAEEAQKLNSGKSEPDAKQSIYPSVAPKELLPPRDGTDD